MDTGLQGSYRSRAAEPGSWVGNGWEERAGGEIRGRGGNEGINKRQTFVLGCQGKEMK